MVGIGKAAPYCYRYVDDINVVELVLLAWGVAAVQSLIHGEVGNATLGADVSLQMHKRQFKLSALWARCGKGSGLELHWNLGKRCGDYLWIMRLVWNK